MSAARPVPYPADTRAKGWRFEIDYERVEQSDTWDVAAEVPMAQHALLFMWMTAWTQVPCGSLPADEQIIRAKCRIPADLWASLRPILMRGWWLAEDGRLYHDTIVGRAQEMLEYRRRNADRVAKSKAKTKESHVGNALPTGEQHGDSHGSYITGTGTIDTSPSLRSGDGAAKPPSPARKKSEAKTLSTYLAECKTAKSKPVPDDHYVRRWGEDAGLAPEMLQIAWVQFRERYTVGEKGRGKRYKDWPGHFASAVKGNWFKLWFADAGEMKWTTQGLTHKAVLDAQIARNGGEHGAG